MRALDAIEPGPRALELAAEHDKDARLVQAVLDESAEVLRARDGVLICETHHGFVCANAGVDQSNASRPGELVLLPADPDESARRLRAGLAQRLGARPAVVVSDSFGRPWRLGQTDVAIGAAGLARARRLERPPGRLRARAARDRDRDRRLRRRGRGPRPRQGLAPPRGADPRPGALRDRPRTAPAPRCCGAGASRTCSGSGRAADEAGLAGSSPWGRQRPSGLRRVASVETRRRTEETWPPKRSQTYAC